MKTINQERNYGIDLLRMVSMSMIVLLHILLRGGLLNSNRLSFNYEWAWALESLCVCAVNCYALISGYVGIYSKFRYSNIIYLWLQTFVYSFGFAILFYIFVPGSVGLGSVLKYALPVISNQYWYFTAYFFLFFFIPALNYLINNFEQKSLKVLIFSIIVLFSIYQTIPIKDAKLVLGINDGYSMLWLALLYIIGGYIRKYGVFHNINQAKAFMLYIFCAMVAWLFKFIVEYLGISYTSPNSSIILNGDIFIQYTSPTALLSGIALLFIFSSIKINIHIKKLIAILSPLSFSVYLIHTHPLIWSKVLGDNFKSFFNLFTTSYQKIAITLVLYILIYSTCSLIDAIRSYLFKLLNIRKFSQFIENLLKNIFRQLLKKFNIEI